MSNIYLKSLRAGALAAALAWSALPLALAQTPESAVTLVKANPPEGPAAPDAGRPAFAEDYRQFDNTHVGKSSQPEVFTLSFNATTRVTAISASNDFHVSGGTCIEGHTYAAGDQCTVEAIFTPRGPGHRTGKLTIAHTASAVPLLVPIGADAVGPAMSFIPSRITTLPTTLVNGTGLLLDAQGLAVDGGDSLYIADTGNDVIRYQDSSGVLSVLAGGGTAAPTSSSQATGVKLNSPYGIVNDTFGNTYFSDSGDKLVLGVGLAGLLYIEIGDGTGVGNCSYLDPCNPRSILISEPFGIAMDPFGNLFVDLERSTNSGGTPDGMQPAEDSANHFYPLFDFWGQYTTAFPLAVDSYEDIYYALEVPAKEINNPANLCYIMAQNKAEGIVGMAANTWIVAGTRRCGFSGDGGPATGAEISTSVQGFAWDAAGNFYFTDTGNNVVRRIDAIDGVIRTIAGNGDAAYNGDGGPSTSASFNAPTGIAVNSRGNVYAIGTQEVRTVDAKPAALDQGGPNLILKLTESIDVVREFGAVGDLVFAAQPQSTPSPAKTILVSNVGNDALNITSAAFAEGDIADFAIDPITTSCNFTKPLLSGQNCRIGVIFTPTATGMRSALLGLSDNTADGGNGIEVSGTAVAPSVVVRLSPQALAFAAQNAGTASATQEVELENEGKSALIITSYEFTGAEASVFSETHACGATLKAGAKCAIEISFKPKAVGSSAATFSVRTSAGTATLAVTGKSE
jgi:hypothetical protein